MNVEEILQTTMKVEIIKALKEAPEAIDAMVKAALNKPIETGRGYERMPYLDHLCGEMLREAARQAVREELEARKDDIRRVIAERMSSEAIVDEFAKAVMGAIDQGWQIRVLVWKDDDRGR